MRAFLSSGSGIQNTSTLRPASRSVNAPAVPSCIFTVVRDRDPHCVIARSEIDHKTAFSRTVAFEHLHSNELLSNGLKHVEPDPAWRKALEMAGTLLEKPDLKMG